jgi:prevent-host-death family protein
MINYFSPSNSPEFRKSGIIWENNKMPIIKPISDLRNKSNEISELAHNSGEPIFITKNGKGDLVVMSMSHYSKLQFKLDLLGKLSFAQNQKADGDNGKTLKQVMQNIRATINAGR